MYVQAHSYLEAYLICCGNYQKGLRWVYNKYECLTKIAFCVKKIATFSEGQFTIPMNKKYSNSYATQVTQKKIWMLIENSKDKLCR